MKIFTIDQLKQQFVNLYGGGTADLRVFTAPGRVNLIGEHTDYNGGHVFPAAITMGTTLIARMTGGKTIRLAATDLPDRVVAETDRLDNYRGLKWGNYQLGTAYEVQKAGYDIVGCDLLSYGNVPYGSGLSSSASVEVSAAIAFITFSNEKNGLPNKIDMVQVAKLSQAAEHNYAGVNCGIMDQFASAMGRRDQAILLNCKDVTYRHIPLRLGDCRLVLMNTNKKRSLADSKYNERRSECEAALKILQSAIPEATCLCDITPQQFEANKSLIVSPTVVKRARHVVYENNRVLKSVAALEKGDLARFGELMNESHDSLCADYEVTGIELDTLANEARKTEGVLGARMTGAGFGGCGVALVKAGAAEALIARVSAAYRRAVGFDASFYLSDIGDGGRELK